MMNKLKGMPETLLIPLWARASETGNPGKQQKQDGLFSKMVKRQYV